MTYNRQGALKLVFALGRKNGYDADELRALACSLFGIKDAHLSKLSPTQLSALIAQLQGKAPIVVTNGATSRQIWLIKQLEARLEWKDNPARLSGFIARNCHGIDDVHQLSVPQASAIIEALKALTK